MEGNCGFFQERNQRESRQVRQGRMHGPQQTKEGKLHQSSRQSKVLPWIKEPGRV